MSIQFRFTFKERHAMRYLQIPCVMTNDLWKTVSTQHENEISRTKAEWLNKTLTRKSKEMLKAYCLHSPSQAQREVQGMLSLTHLHRLVRQPVLHPYRFSSGQHLAASGIVVHTGCQQLSTERQPQSLGLGSLGCKSRDWLQIWPPW